MANLKNITELPIAESADGVNLIVNDHGVAKQIPSGAVGAQPDWAETDNKSPAFIKNKPSKELIYEWNFSAEDEVYEVYENVDADLSWLTRYQDGVSFEIITENYAYQYDYNDENGEHNRTYLQDITSICSSTEIPYFSRYVNLPYHNDGEQELICKETLRGEIYGYEVSNNYMIDDNTERCFKLYPGLFFNIDNGVHYDFDNGGTPANVENGGSIVLETYDCPLKSVKIYKITR